jgi:hypothetical protein
LTNTYLAKFYTNTKTSKCEISIINEIIYERNN